MPNYNLRPLERTFFEPRTPNQYSTSRILVVNSVGSFIFRLGQYPDPLT